MAIDYKKYDQICATGVQWLLYNKQKGPNHILCFTNIDSYDNADKWLLSIARAVEVLDGTNIYVHIGFIDYLALKYKHKFKIKYAFKKSRYCVIDGQAFENEIIENFEESRMILEKIYNEYYRR